MQDTPAHIAGALATRTSMGGIARANEQQEVAFFALLLEMFDVALVDQQCEHAADGTDGRGTRDGCQQTAAELGTRETGRHEIADARTRRPALRGRS